MIKKISLLFLIMISLISCNESLKEKMNGLWILEEIYYEDKDYLDSISYKIVKIDEKNIMIHSTNEINAEWDIIQYKGIDTLVINSNDKIFKGKFELLFALDTEDNSVFCKLLGEKTIIILHKIDLENLIY
ncbi:hypothetical protein [Mariniflexile sp.]|uniref:hypothetical protein n=1 Tax=Mariniflexile sp. TaxID=1979402 RepID=UPI004048D310